MQDPVFDEQVVPIKMGKYTQIEGSAKCNNYKSWRFGGLLGIFFLAAIVFAAVAFTKSPGSDTPAQGASNDGYKATQPVHSMENKTDSPTSACKLATGSYDITINGRKVNLFVPTVATMGPLPLILMFHGITSTPQDVEAKARLQLQTIGLIIAYPYGSGSMKAFNGAGCCEKNGPDDVELAKQIITYLESTGCTQVHNVFVSGFSNGAFMAHRVGCEAGFRPDGEPWVRAIAPHSGLIGSYSSTPYVCATSQNLPVLAFHGSADKTVPISGNNPNPFNSAVWNSLQATVDIWVSKNKCSNASPEVVQKTSTTKCYKYSGGCSVQYCVADGLGHEWMGHERKEDYDATHALLEFFTEHCIPGKY